MIAYLKNSEIDKDSWDACVSASPCGKAWGMSWLLDIMSPGWHALVEDDYEAVFPLPALKKYGVNYLANPIFVRELGLFSPERHEDNLVTVFAGYIPLEYKLIDILMPHPIKNNGFVVTEKVNYELSLSLQYDDIRSRYTRHCIRNIEFSSRRNPRLTSDVKPAEIIRLFRENRGKNIPGIKENDFMKLESLISHTILNGKGRLLGVRDGRNRLIYGIFLLENALYTTMALVVNTNTSREQRIGYYIVDYLIQESAGKRKILDFAGSVIPSVASFMESFSPTRKPVYRIYRNTLPWPLRLFK